MSEPHRRLTIPALLALLLLLFLLPVTGQQQVERFRGDPASTHASGLPARDADRPGEFTFVRIVYDSPDPPYNEYNRWFGGAWRVDYPDADENFMMGIREWAGSNLRLSAQPVQLRATDEHLFDYPFCYIVEPGHMELTDADAAALREYLLRGGFL